MPTEDLVAYRSHLKSLTDEYHPAGATEANLVQALADASWRLNRVAALETNLLTLTAVLAPDPISGAVSMAAAIGTHSKALANLSMHSQRLSRQFERTVIQLRDLQPRNASRGSLRAPPGIRRRVVAKTPATPAPCVSVGLLRDEAHTLLRTEI
jgi:hypothetical protein